MRASAIGGLGSRLVAAFVRVALTAEAVFASVVLLTEPSGVASVQRSDTTAAVLSALVNAYRANGGWQGADLKAAVALANVPGAALSVRSASGRQVLRAGPPARFGAKGTVVVTRPVTSGGRRVGTVQLGFPKAMAAPARQQLRSALAGALLLSALAAAAVAFVVALAAGQAIVRPVRRLSSAARAVGSGVAGARVGPHLGRGELAELGKAFDEMADSLERHERLRQVMVADIAHELRTPVAVLQAETESLVDGVRPATPAALASLHEESVRLGRMIEDLRVLASADAAGLRLERSLVDLAVVATEAASSLEGRFARAKVRLVRDLSAALVLADARRLHQVVTNLLDNAAKFTPAGGTARLVVRRDGQDAYLEVSDSDTGPGVLQAEREQIFERFFRGSAAPLAGGTGIGLAVVKQVVEAHGGDVRALDAPGGGARFVARLPLAPAGRTAAGPEGR